MPFLNLHFYESFLLVSKKQHKTEKKNEKHQMDVEWAQQTVNISESMSNELTVSGCRMNVVARLHRCRCSSGRPLRARTF